MSNVDLDDFAARYALEDVERWDDAIVVAKRGRTGVVLLDRPQSGNAHNRAMIHALAKAWLHFGNDRGVRVIVIGSTNDRNFCTGIDLKEVAAAGGFAGLAEQSGYGPVLGSGQTHRDAGVRKPVVTAIEGRAIGGGLHWVAEADIVIAGTAATFRDTHVERGFVGNRENLDLALKAGLGAALYMSLVGGQVVPGCDARPHVGSRPGGRPRRHGARQGIRAFRDHRSQLAHRHGPPTRDAVERHSHAP